MTAKYRKMLTVFLLSALIFSLSATLHAGRPVWTFTPLTATSISVPANSTATIQYQVTNQSAKSHRLMMKPITGITQTTTGVGICSNPFTLPASGSSCTLSLQVNGSQLTQSITDGPIVCEQGLTLQCYKPSLSNSLNINNDTTLRASVSTLGLSVNNTGLNAALTGTPRLITITNLGTNSATSVTYSPSPALPSGTMISPASCGTIAASGTCVLTITPGSTESATAGNTSPTPITLSISGTNTNTLTPTLNIVTYGSVYQSGYVYAVDDTTPTTGSIGGKVASLTDQALAYPYGIIWSSDGSGTTVSNIAILGIDQLSTTSSPSPTSPTYPTGTPAYTACNGNSDGSCDTSNIVSYYNFNRTTGGAAPTPLTQYASGLCKAIINGYSDWYLPAICEEGYDKNTNGSGCGTLGSPTLQNIQSNLVDNGNVGSLSGFYWSSTETLRDPTNEAWFQLFASGGSSNQGYSFKSFTLGVRCSRALTLG